MSTNIKGRRKMTAKEQIKYFFDVVEVTEGKMGDERLKRHKKWILEAISELESTIKKHKLPKNK